MENLTQEQINQCINAAFDSVNLINKLDEMIELTDEELASKNRNIDHLKVMMSKEWFVSALTSEQKVEIENIIN